MPQERMSPMRPLWLTAAPVLFLLLWSAGFPIAKIGIAHAEPMTLLALRYCAVLMLLAPLALILRPPLPQSLRAGFDVAVTGFLIQVVYFGLCYLAFKSGTSSGTVAIVVCLQPILVALLAPRLAKEPVSRRTWAGLALGLAGAVLVILSHAEIAAQSAFGLASTFLALLGMTGATLYEKRFGVTQHPITANLIQYAVGAMVTLPLALATETTEITWDGEFLAVMAYLVLGNSLLAISLLLAMIRAGEVARVSALFYLVPPLAALFAWPLLGEALAPLGWAGMALAAVGVGLASRRAG